MPTDTLSLASRSSWLAAVRENSERAWDVSKGLELTRYDHSQEGEVILEPGVNFFVMALENLGATTYFSCEGHPTGFYIAVKAPYKLMCKVEACGFFHVEISRSTGAPVNFCIRLREGIDSIETRDEILRWAATAWMTGLLS